MEPEWAKFKVGEVSTRRNWTNQDCQPFETVSHVAHHDIARRIMCDGIIRSGLVCDESKLNTERILVSWLSPNDWSGAGGFRYGNVRLRYDFEPLVTGKNCYWVESLAYGIKACRILITENDRSDLLDPYDPSNRDGPWWYDTESKTHYRNGYYTLEFMFEDDLRVRNSASLDFVRHHDHQCNISPGSCPDSGISGPKAALKFMAFLLSDTCRLPKKLFTDTHNGSSFFNDDYLSHFGLLRRLIIDNATFTGHVTAGSDTAKALVRAIFHSYADEHKDEPYDLAALFESGRELEVAMDTYALARFNLTELSYD
ncbi:hypothetical protein EG832_01490 [bacterium]|nr:hypothetical protein [bacterium]